MVKNMTNKITGILNPIIKWIKTNYKIMIVLVLVVIVGLIIYRLLFKEPFAATNPFPTLPVSSIILGPITELKTQLETISDATMTVETYNTTFKETINVAIRFFNDVTNFSDSPDKPSIIENLDIIIEYLNDEGKNVESLNGLKNTFNDNESPNFTDFRESIINEINTIGAKYTNSAGNELVEIATIDFSSINNVQSDLQTILNNITIDILRRDSNTIQIAKQTIEDLREKLIDVKNRADAIEKTQNINRLINLIIDPQNQNNGHIFEINRFLTDSGSQNVAVDISGLNSNISILETLKGETITTNTDSEYNSKTITELINIINNINTKIGNYNNAVNDINAQIENYNNNYPSNNDINTYNETFNDLTEALRFASSIEASISNNVEFELADPIISVTDIDRIEIRLKYKNIDSNIEPIYYDLQKVVSGTDIKYYPRNETDRKRLSIIYQNFSPDPENMVDNQVVEEIDTNLDAKVTIRNKNGQDRLLNDGTNNKIERGGEIILSIKVKDEYKKALFDTTNSNKFYLMMDFSSNGTGSETDYNTNKKSLIPIELRFRRDIYYTIALPNVNESGQTETNYVSRVHSDKPLKVYSDAVGKGELHRIMLVDQADRGARDNYVPWDSGQSNEGFLIRSANDNKDLFYKIDSSGYMKLVKSSSPFDLLEFEFDARSQRFRIKKKNDNIYADKSFIFQVEKNSNGQFINIFNSRDAEAGLFKIDESTTDVKDIVTVGDYVQDTIDKTRPTDSGFGKIYYTYVQRAYTFEDIKNEHSNGAVMVEDNLRRNAYVRKHGTNSKIVTVQFDDTARTDENGFLLINNVKSVSEFFIYLELTYTVDLSTSVTFLPSEDIFVPTNRAVPSVGSPKVYTFYGIGSTDGKVQVFDYINEKYKPSLYEGQKIKDSTNEIRYVHRVKEHIPHSVKSLQPEVIIVAMPLDKINLSTNKLSADVNIKMKHVDVKGTEQEYEHRVTANTQLTTLNDCNKSVILNNLNKLRNISGNEYEIIGINHPDYNKINFGRCDNLLNRDDDIKDMREANTFVKGILGNLFNKTGDMLSRRSFELTNIQTTEDALLNSPVIKDFNNYEKNSLYDTNPFTKMDEISNYYQVKGKEGFQNSIISESSINNFLGSYYIQPGQLILLDGVKVQIDKNYLGFIQQGIPIMKFSYDSILPIYSPFQKFNGVKLRIVSQDKMVHSIATKNLENLFYNTGLRSPNFIYISRHTTPLENNKESVMYRVSNREYTTLFQMKKLESK